MTMGKSEAWNKRQDALVEEFSLDQLQSNLRDAVSKSFDYMYYIVEAYPTYIIVQGNSGKFRRIDYTVDDNGNVKLGEPAPVQRVFEPTTEEALVWMDAHGIEILEEADAASKKGMRIRGVALIDNAISENGRFYSEAFNDKVVASTKKYMEEGNVTTIFSRHGKAVGNPTIGELPTGLPIGKVTKLYRDGNKIKYEGTIAPTSEGRDVMVLIESDVMRPTSIRCKPPVKSRMSKIGDRRVEVMEDAVINGIDFAERAGVLGAGIESVLEEAPQFDEKPEAEMDWSKVTLEELTANRPDLIDQIKQDEQATFSQVKTELDSKVSTLEEQLATATQLVEDTGKGDDTLTEELNTTKLQLAMARAAHLGVSGRLMSKLEEVVKAESDIAAHLPALKAQVIEEARNSFGSGRGTDTSAGGMSNLPDDKKPPRGGSDRKSDSAMDDILRLSR